MSKFLKNAFHPVPQVEQGDTSLRYTDILFGFVIKELFVRLQNWNQLNGAVKLHLVVGATLVLGSWIGFRRSLHRSSYQVKFFNLPLFRFLVDQLMLILYFRVSVLTAVELTKLPPADELARHTTSLIAFVFVLYFVWDVLGMWMAKAEITAEEGNNKRLYPQQSISWAGVLITLSSLIVAVALWLGAKCLVPNALFLSTTALLLVYRWAKEIRTSWHLPPA